MRVVVRQFTLKFPLCYFAVRLGNRPSSCNVSAMNDGSFTPAAAVLWAMIPNEARERILANVFCVKCRTSVTITNFTGEEKNGHVILTGACANCGHEVVRGVESSEMDRSLN